MEFDKEMCPIVKVDGFLEKGKQFDLDITIPEDNRNVIYGVIKDCYKDPVEDAVVKLIEVCFEHGHEERKPVSHTFTDKDGEFVFGPLCPDKNYEVQISNYCSNCLLFNLDSSCSHICIHRLEAWRRSLCLCNIICPFFFYLEDS